MSSSLLDQYNMMEDRDVTSLAGLKKAEGRAAMSAAVLKDESGPTRKQARVVIYMPSLVAAATWSGPVCSVWSRRRSDTS